MSENLTVAVIGCGSIGTSIASGVLDSLAAAGASGRVIATVESEASKQRIEGVLQHHAQRFSARQASKNLETVQEADVIILAVKPFKRHEFLGVEEIRQALKGKLLISIMAGIPTTLLGEVINQGDTTNPCQVIRAMPNMAARIKQAMTLLTSTPGTVAPENLEIAYWVFGQVGDYKYIPEQRFDVAGPIVGCAGSLMALAIDGLLDAAVAEGLKRKDAEFLAVRSTIGMLNLIVEGTHPSLLREQIASPGGASVRALLKLESHGVRYAFSDALMTAADRMRNMSKFT
ncbi:hypothetical protein ACO1O0_007002 [Amphichorda felina]